MVNIKSPQNNATKIIHAHPVNLKAAEKGSAVKIKPGP